jgi:O-antigen/teichoic acid export membrane protein
MGRSREGSGFDAVILRRLPRLALVTAASSLVSGAVGFVAAAWLGPVRYGEVQFVLVFYGVASVFQIGFFLDGARRAIHLRGQGDIAGGVKYQNVGTTYELLASIPPALVIAALAIFVTSPVERTGLLLGVVGVPVASMAGFLGGLEIGYDRTDRATVVAAVGSLVAAGLTIAGIPLVGPLSLLLAPICGNILSVALLLPRLRSLGLRPDLDQASARLLAVSGFPLAASTFCYWAYRWVGQAAVGIGLGARQLGFYSIAVGPVTVAIGAMTVAVRIFLPRFWQLMATDERSAWTEAGDRATTLFMAIGFGLTLIGQAAFPWFVAHVLPHYGPSVPVFEILSLEIPLYLVAQPSSLVLDSVVVNRQRVHLLIWLLALLTNIGVDALLVTTGWGAAAIAWADVTVQLFVVAALFVAARPFQGAFRRRLGTLGPAMTAAGVGGVVSAVLVVPVLRGWPDLNSLATLGMRVGIAAVGLAGIIAGVVIPRGRASKPAAISGP